MAEARLDDAPQSIGFHRAVHWPQWALWALMSGEIRAGGCPFDRAMGGEPSSAHECRRLAREWHRWEQGRAARAKATT